MLNTVELLIDAFVEKLKAGYHRTYGGYKPQYEDIIGWAGNMALENLANSDALYHNMEHTILVSLVGQEILRGKHIREGGVTCEDWLHFIISLVCHNIGYVKGVCRQDQAGSYATGKDGKTVVLPDGSTDASLTPYRVDRGKLFVDERFGGHKLIDVEQIKRNIELTRFPMPSGADELDSVNFPGLVRASALIGQLCDPRYFKKIGALYYEFEEIGLTKELGYNNPGDLRHHYPKYFWRSVYPYIQDALRYLSLTQQGKQIIANLQANVFVLEHEQIGNEESPEAQLVRASNGAA
ncbi:Npun_R2479 family HD domain-containing metalloprotein [Microcoleus sp. FACHB-672]|uniref:Npun_R2479 family HD domain-containing metalloprotein n=1 Tax=Microcoleus sp. FACHB-672 TaxID=2692825 RepID=UPI001686EE57|nr:Npun_R2479 family HD domain-containing metalloprotein [Microcoleus sp. FACHB-672]MBD2040919.1 metal-dependent phosphohydrolase [Microcoleus sp. FACHB-672]